MDLGDTAQTTEIGQGEQGQDNGNHVNWKGIIVPVPIERYNAGGVLTHYNAKSVENILNFVYNQFMRGYFHEIRSEECHERHAAYLIETAGNKAIADSKDEMIQKITYFFEKTRPVYLKILKREIAERDLEKTIKQNP